METLAITGHLNQGPVSAIIKVNGKFLIHINCVGLSDKLLWVVKYFERGYSVSDLFQKCLNVSFYLKQMITHWEGAEG